MQKFYLLFFFIICIVHNTFPQDPFFKFYRVDKVDQNLRLNKLYQDKKGFIWIGTSNGLYKFDGLNFTNLPTDTILNNGAVTAIYEDESNNIWIGYNSGKIGIFKRDSIKLFSLLTLEISTPVTDITQDKDGTMWISTYGEGIYLLNKRNETKSLTNELGLSDNYVYVLYRNSDNLIYAGTDRGISVCHLQNNRINIKLLSSSDGLPDNIVQEIVGDASGNLWIGMQDAGVCFYETNTGKFQQSDVLKSWNYGPVTSIVVSHDELWIGTASNGIVDYEFEGDLRFRPFNRSTGHEFSRINDMLKNSEGNIFIASATELIQSPGERLEFLLTYKNKSIDNVHAVLADKERNLWFSTDEGLFHYIMSRNKSSEIKSYLPGRYHFISLYEDCHGRIWAGTYDKGVLIVDTKTGEVKNLTERDGIVNGNILSISGFNCEVWLATLGGVSMVNINDKSEFLINNYSKTQGLANNYIYYVFTDSKHREWFATDGHGITVLENGEFINYSSDAGLKSDIIYSITEDKKGNIWFSTSTAGIYKFDGRKFKNFGLSEGIRDLSISALTADKIGNIVIVHRKGIDLLNAATEKVTSLGIEAGVTELNSDLNSVTQDRKGNIWIGSQKGLIKYAGHFPNPDLKPITHINKVLLFLEEATNRRFTSKENHISIDFIGLWYSNPELVNYQYMLEGYTRDWVKTKDHFITFSNLPPGNYTFRVRSAIGDDFSNATEKSVSFIINKPFYATSWFIVLTILVLGAVSLLIIRYRETKLKERENIEKEKIEFQFETLKSQVNPHFLFNSFNTLINIIEDDKNRAVEYVEKLSVFFRNIVKYRDKEVVSLEEELSLVESYLFLQQKRYGNNLRMCVQDNIDRIKYCIPPLTLQLLIENAIKHNAISRDKILNIKIFQENGYLVVENNINNKKNVETSTGFGLQNIITRYKLLNKREVKIDHTPDYFKVRLPLINC